MLAITACKLSRKFLHLFGKGGTAAPGKLALFLDRQVLAAASRGMQVILVTGTNGKTTTSRMLEEAAEQSGRTCLLNRSGANLLSGITAEFVCNTDMRGRPKTRYAVIECDEGALKQVVPLVKPKAILVTNLFRDQLDRYGEVMNTRSEILTGIRLAPESILCLNADCPLTASMAGEVPNQVRYYGINVPIGDQQERELSDARYCVHCGAEYHYDYYTYAHLGGYHCPNCGFSRPDPDIAVTKLLDLSSESTGIQLQIDSHEYEARVGLPAVYNLYNALAAVCAGKTLGMKEDALMKAIGSVSACFGRMETFDLAGVPVQMILVKNPAGCDQAAGFIAGLTEPYDLVFCLNDKTADGHDISWIWDADLEKLADHPLRRSVFVSGTRAEDMQLRLKYAGISQEEITMEKSVPALVGRLEKSERKVFILPNYTSMLELRKALLSVTGKEDFWKG